MATAEKRTHCRVPYSGRVDYYCWDQRRSAEALEISADGIFLRSSEVLPEGSLITLRLSLPGFARGFTVLGRVVHVVLGGVVRRRGMGVHFLDIAPRDRDRILSYAAQRPRLSTV
jgi:c-di-GMP-binding flagellar brake protein YcgR